MKIVLMNETWGMGGGQEEYILRVGNGLASRGHKVSLLYGRQTGPIPKDARFEVYGLNNLAPHKVLGFMNLIKPDIINLQNVYNPKIIKECLRRFPTTRFVHDHSTYCPGNSKYFFESRKVCPLAVSPLCLVNAHREHCMTRRPLSAVNRIWQRHSWLSSLKGLSVVLCNSNYVKERLVQNGVLESKVMINHLFPGHEVPFLTENIRDDSEVQKVLFVGRLFKEKGVNILIDASARLKKKKFKLLIVGDGWERQNLEKQAVVLGLKDRVEFHGFRSGQELSNLYQRCSFLVMPSIWPEPFGMAGLEANAFGKPVVAFRVGGIPDWLENGVNGFLLDEVSVESLAQGLDMLLSNHELRLKMGEQGRDKVENYFNLDRHLDVLEETYSRLV
ncbi:MAG: glycosyltransferase family 4 protein [Patescibacteria group bacterium]|nr:glycosyltransferase family 4 protein [Patescibacteria group bacterium]